MSPVQDRCPAASWIESAVTDWRPGGTSKQIRLEDCAFLPLTHLAAFLGHGRILSMLREVPAWTVVAQRCLTQGYGYVRLMRRHALGEWICVERDTGGVLWEHEFDRPNSISGVADDVIVATENLSVGLGGNGSFHGYGLELETGHLVWTSHPSGQCGERSAEGYSYPDRYDQQGADAAPTLVEEGQCFCADGRVLDAASGREIGRIPADEVEMRATRMRSDPASALYWSRNSSSTRNSGFPIAPGRRLRLGIKRSNREFSVHLNSEDGTNLWTFTLTRAGYEMTHPNFYSYRWAGQYLYLVVSEPIEVEPTPTPGQYTPPPPRRFHLLTLELERGTVVQDLPIETIPLAECRIEDVDEHGLLISSNPNARPYVSGKVLRYFERLPGWGQPEGTHTFNPKLD